RADLGGGEGPPDRPRLQPVAEHGASLRRALTASAGAALPPPALPPDLVEDLEITEKEQRVVTEGEREARGKRRSDTPHERYEKRSQTQSLVLDGALDTFALQPSRGPLDRVPVALDEQRQAFSRSRTTSFTARGSAFPYVSRINWPTQQPRLPS